MLRPTFFSGGNGYSIVALTLIGMFLLGVVVLGVVEQGAVAQEASAQNRGTQQAGLNWPTWRGPTGDGIAATTQDGEAAYPDVLSLDDNLLWKVDLPGPGSSTPVVWGDRLFLTCIVDGSDTACCYDMAGKPLWTATLGAAAEAKHRNATGANPSAVTDGKHVAVYFKSGNLAMLTPEGKKLWELDLQEKYGENTLWWDLGSSPVLTKAGVVVVVMQDDMGYLACFDLRSGQEVWKTPRNYDRPRESGQSYTTPIVSMVDGRQQIITFGADHLTGHDAATGKLVWHSGGFNPENKPMWRTIASPVLSDGLAVIPFGRTDFVSAVRVGGEGEVTASNQAWQLSGIGADVPTPAATDGKAYVLGDRGTVTCLDLATGDQHWSGKLPRARDKYFASPTIFANQQGQRMIVAREDGVVSIVKLDQSLELLSQVDLEETTVATPVLVGGRVLLRSREHLYCFGASR